MRKVELIFQRFTLYISYVMAWQLKDKRDTGTYCHAITKKFMRSAGLFFHQHVVASGRLNGKGMLGAGHYVSERKGDPQCIAAIITKQRI